MDLQDRKEGIRIHEMPEDTRPRERALLHGIRELTDAELIAIQLRTGTKSANALELAKQLLAAHDNNLYRLYADLLADVNAEQNISGLGAVKRLSVLAAQELGVRTYVASVEEKQREERITMSQHVYTTMQRRLFGLKEEQMWLLTISSAGLITATINLSRGGIDETSADIRLTMRHALRLSAPAIIMVHNHPGGGLEPSKQDDDFTFRLSKACKIMGIQLLDHIIYTDTGYYSYLDQCRLL